MLVKGVGGNLEPAQGYLDVLKMKDFRNFVPRKLHSRF